MDSLDPTATRYGRLGKELRKFEHRTYRGPEKRLEKRRILVLKKS
jgi:hypothetical protein